MTSEPTTSTKYVQLRLGSLAIVFAALGALGLFLATSVLLLRGGQDVGKHLQLLRYYLPGFTVTWPGAFLGLGYGALIGAVLGAAIATISNAVTKRRERK